MDSVLKLVTTMKWNQRFLYAISVLSTVAAALCYDSVLAGGISSELVSLLMVVFGLMTLHIVCCAPIVYWRALQQNSTSGVLLSWLGLSVLASLSFQFFMRISQLGYMPWMQEFTVVLFKAFAVVSALAALRVVFAERAFQLPVKQLGCGLIAAHQLRKLHN